MTLRAISKSGVAIPCYCISLNEFDDNDIPINFLISFFPMHESDRHFLYALHGATHFLNSFFNRDRRVVPKSRDAVLWRIASGEDLS
jgi:hypothetical protein